MLGGYKIIDLKKTQLTINEPVVIDGIYNEIEGDYGKVILLEGIDILGDLHTHAYFVNFTTVNGDFVCTVPVVREVEGQTVLQHYLFIIDSEDEVAVSII